MSTTVVSIATTDAKETAKALGGLSYARHLDEVAFGEHVELVIGAVARFGRPVAVWAKDGSFSAWHPRTAA